MQEQKVTRNAAIVLLRKFDPKMFSYGHLSELFKIEKSMLHKVFERDKNKYLLPEEKS